MQAIFRQAFLLLEQLFNSSMGSIQFGILMGLGGVVLLSMMDVTGHSCGVRNCGFISRITAAVVGVGIALAAAGATRLYLLPHIAGQTLQLTALIGVPVLVTALVTVPILMPVMRSHYGNIAFMFLSSSAVTVIAMLVGITMLSMVIQGDRQGQWMRSRSSEFEHVAAYGR